MGYSALIVTTVMTLQLFFVNYFVNLSLLLNVWLFTRLKRVVNFNTFSSIFVFKKFLYLRFIFVFLIFSLSGLPPFFMFFLKFKCFLLVQCINFYIFSIYFLLNIVLYIFYIQYLRFFFSQKKNTLYKKKINLYVSEKLVVIFNLIIFFNLFFFVNIGYLLI